MDRFLALFRNFFNDDYLNPHGICLLWRPELIWTHATADVLIGLAYFSIPAALGVFLYHRRDIRFGWAIWMFVLFIMLCGVTHFMSVLTLWRPYYGLEALIKVATAVASLITAAALWPLLPKVIALPSQSALQVRISERDSALEELRAAMGAMVEMREHERRQRLLLDELNHRVKNTLASVQSIAMQTLDSAPSTDAFQSTFMSRLMSLSSTHDVLVRREWQSARFSELVASTLDHYGRPYDVTGPDLWLAPNTAVTLGLALHELSTNAVKHGAWSGDAGRVDISTAVGKDGRAFIVWRETGGPTVRKPSRAGFGSRLLRRGVARDLDGEVDLEFRTEGLVCSIRTSPHSDRIRVVDPGAADMMSLHD
jgi:two-component sensor histidine kinase